MSGLSPMSSRVEHELAHGRYLVEHGPERIWGWDTPAGQIRADRRAAMIIQGAGLKPGMNVLEVGCGTGIITQRLLQSGANFVAVDLSRDLLELARQRGLDPQRVRFVEGKFEESELHGPFDAIVGSSVLHHLEVEQSLRRIRALLPSGGAMAFAEPNMMNPQIALQKNIPAIKRMVGDSPDETAFFRWSMRRMLSRIGFTEIRITPFDWLHPSTPRPLIPLIGAIGRLVERVPVVREFSGSMLIAARVP